MKYRYKLEAPKPKSLGVKPKWSFLIESNCPSREDLKCGEEEGKGEPFGEVKGDVPILLMLTLQEDVKPLNVLSSGHSLLTSLRLTFSDALLDVHDSLTSSVNVTSPQSPLPYVETFSLL